MAGDVMQFHTLVVLPIRTKADLPSAIAAAANNPGARWYVERRVKALGASDEFPLPWRKHEQP